MDTVSKRLSCLDSPDTDHDRKPAVWSVKFGRTQLLGRHSVPKGRSGQDVAIPANRDSIRIEHLPKKSPAGRNREAPILDVREFAVHATDRRHRYEENAAWAENASSVGEGGAQLVDELKRLSHDEAIETIRGNRVRGSQVRMYRRARIERVDVQDVTALNVDAEALRVAAVLHLQHVSANIVSMRGEKPFDVISVYGRASISAPTVAQRREPTKAPEPRRSIKPTQPFPQFLPPRWRGRRRRRAQFREVHARRYAARDIANERSFESMSHAVRVRVFISSSQRLRNTLRRKVV